MNIAWHDVVGTLGVAAVVGSYLLLQLGRLDPKSLGYSLANALGAGLVVLSLAYDFNLSAFVIEAFWVVVSLVGVWRWWHRRRE